MQVTDSDNGQRNVALIVTEQPEKTRICSVAQKLVMLASFVKELQTQSHLIHFNYEGSNFLEVHGFLKDQYDAHLEQFDKIGEYVRALNYWMPMCSIGLKDALPCFRNIESYDGREMLTVYYQNLGDLAGLLKMVEPAAQEAQALDVANYLAELLGEINKSCWMVRATLNSCSI